MDGWDVAGRERRGAGGRRREDAIAECIAEGHTVIVDGGLIEITPAEVLGDTVDGWTVTVAA